MRKSSYLAIALVALTQFSAPAKAGIADFCVGAFFRLTVGSARRFDNQTVKYRSKENGNFELELGRRIGVGMTAAVYPVNEVRGLTIPELRPEDKLVVKVGHQLKLFGIRNPISSLAMGYEHHFYSTLKTSLPKLEADPLYPKDPAWGKGRLPVAPILKAVQTDRGLLLFKPYIKGRNIGQLSRDLNIRTEADFPPEMLASLKEIYGLTQAAFDSASAYGKPVSLDLNPQNLVWVDDPVVMKQLGLQRPSFYFYEMGYMPGNYFHRDNVSFDAYAGLVAHKAYQSAWGGNQ